MLDPAANVEAGSDFGEAVAISGNVAIVGAEDDILETNPGLPPVGSASVYRTENGATWALEQKLLPSLPVGFLSEQDFAVSVDIDGDVVVVGAPRFGSDGGFTGEEFNGPGAAYIFRRDEGGTWVVEQIIQADDPIAFGEFGFSVCLRGETVVVGARQEGAAYVFERVDGLWVQDQRLVAPNDAGDQFGSSVGMDSSSIIVGAPQDNDAGGLAGSAYVFVLPDGARGWMFEAELLASDAAAGDNFGNSVGIAADRIIVGAHFDTAGAFQSGSAYVFERSRGRWIEHQKLTASDAAATDRFGESVRIQANTILVGAPFQEAPLANSGAVYLFHLQEGQWVERGQITATTPVASARFGLDCDMDLPLMVAGAPMYGPQGSAFVFNVAPSPEPVMDLNCDGIVDGADLGMLLKEWGACPAACPSDFNADGSTDGQDLGQLLLNWDS
jgi:hypothetical protein